MRTADIPWQASSIEMSKSLMLPCENDDQQEYSKENLRTSCFPSAVQAGVWSPLRHKFSCKLISSWHSDVRRYFLFWTLLQTRLTKSTQLDEMRHTQGSVAPSVGVRAGKSAELLQGIIAKDRFAWRRGCNLSIRAAKGYSGSKYYRPCFSKWTSHTLNVIIRDMANQ